MKKKLILIGAGGHSKVIIDLLFTTKEYDVVGILDVKERIGDDVYGVPVVGTDTDLPDLFKKGIIYCFISIGSVGNSLLRAVLYGRAVKAGFKVPTLIHPTALVSHRAVFGIGNYIGPRVVINAGTRIGNNCIINTGAIIEHDCKLGDFVHISPGTVLSGCVTVEEHSHVGTGSVVIQNLNIGAQVIVGAGSVVTKNIRRGIIAYGNPCKERRKNVARFHYC